MYKKHTAEEWREAFRLHDEGLSPLQISRETGISDSAIRFKCSQAGITGRLPMGRKPEMHPTDAQKLAAVKAVVEESLSYAEVTTRFNVSRSRLVDWLGAYRRGGRDGLLAERPARRKENPMPRRKGSVGKEPQTELEKALRENELLRAEVALLKKVRALVRERNARERGNGR